jgi:predicted RNA binding protein YcfA (HicA-like mRNA interferase family)
VKSKDLIKMLEADGWKTVRIKGSHNHLQHPAKKGTITVPHPKSHLGIGLVNKIKKSAGI